MKEVTSHTFRGKKYRIKWRKPKLMKENGKPLERLGYCESPRLPKPAICINPRLREHYLLRTAIDESIHACFFDLGNDEVGQASEDIAKFLEAIGLKIVVAGEK